jgi:hypothetical protein
MKVFISRSQGYLGVFYVPSIKKWHVNLTRNFGIHFQFKFNQKEQEEVVRKIESILDRKDDLSRLTNPELVFKVTSTSLADSELVIEMCDRLDKDWFREEEEND